MQKSLTQAVVGASHARLVEHILLHFKFQQILCFMQKLFVLFFWKQSYTKVQFTTIYTSHHVNVVQRMSAEPDNVCGFCVCRYCCWCWVWSRIPPCSCSCSCYIGGHILRSPPPSSQFHIPTITTMSTIIIVTKNILTYQAAIAECDPTLQLQLPPWMSYMMGTSSGHHHHHHVYHFDHMRHILKTLFQSDAPATLRAHPRIAISHLVAVTLVHIHRTCHNCSNIFGISCENYQSFLSTCPYHKQNYHDNIYLHRPVRKSFFLGISKIVRQF